MKEQDHLNRVFRNIVEGDPTLRALFTTRTPSYRYYEDKAGNRYFHTTETVNRNGKQRYASGVYKHLKAAKKLKLTKVAYHAKRKDAISRQAKLYNQRIIKPQPNDKSM
jgi:hypothetical protein